MPKSERAGYAEAPFFFIEEGDNPYGVAWLPMKLKTAVPKLLRHWPAKLQMHVEILEEDFETVEFEAFGAIARDKLVKALEKHGETAFADGGVRFRIWRLETDREHCLGLDEHGVLYLWEEPDRIREWLEGLGATERTAPLVYEGDHNHSIPEDADLKRNRFLRALGLEEG
ncbi:MAG: hypothetical protein ACYTHK_00125 [Planctomycetota bacterium]|jgi:hypothetical protein